MSSEHTPGPGRERWPLACPLCGGAPLSDGPGGDSGSSGVGALAQCPACESVFRRVHGIWRFLGAPQARECAEFLRQYATVRRDQGWGASQAGYYRSLPRVAPGDPQQSIWRLRASSYNRLLGLLAAPGALNIVDLGAGNCWLANQLARRGHFVAAVDISDNALDGLGARMHYASSFACYQAEFDHLPFRAAQFDVAVMNASLHYAADLASTLLEVTRVLVPGGRAMVIDSPFYARSASGRTMLAERQASYAERYGFVETRPMVGFLTEPDLEHAAARVGLKRVLAMEDNGWRRKAQRALAWVRTGREPARFPILVFQKP